MTATRTPNAIAAELHAFGTDGGTAATVQGAQLPHTGYVVGVSGLGMKVPYPPFPEVSLIEEWVTWRLPHASAPTRAMGSWTDGGYVYFDVVEVYSEKVTAMLKARERGEIAVWDIAANDEINTEQWFKDNPTETPHGKPWTHFGFNER